MRTCTKCGEIKPLDSFPRDNRPGRGRKARCKQCTQAAYRAYCKRVDYHKTRYQRIKCAERWRHIKKKYGVTEKEYRNLLSAQRGNCGICGTKDNGPKPFCVDHDHTTGTVRGLLCTACNQTLGHGKDDPRLFRLAARYLSRKSRQES